MAITRLDNIGVAVRDAAASHAFFAMVPGLTPSELQGTSFTVSAGSQYLWVFQTESPSPGDTRSPDFTSNPRGLDHLAFEVPDIEAASAEFESAGIRFVGDIVGDVGAFRYRGFQDPDGNMLYIIQQAASS